MKKLLLPMIATALASCGTATQSEPQAVTVTAPVSKPTTFETNDSSFLKIDIRGEKFEVDFLKRTVLINDIDGLDSFLQKNKQLINTENVGISSFDTTRMNKNLQDLLSRYGIVKFRVNVD